VKDAQGDPLLREKLAVRRWDDLAKVPDKKVPGLDAYEHVAVKCLVGAYIHVGSQLVLNRQ
jgi:predicted HD phosphohydrolase